MKALLLLLIGAALGIFGYRYYQQTQHPTLEQRTEHAIDTTRQKSGELKEKVVEGTKKVGERVDDAWIITTIKGKYVLDKELSALAISVSCREGRVALSGTVGSEALVGRAVRLASETSGVVDVASQLAVK